MYDKVTLWVDRTIVGEQFPTIANYLNKAKDEVDRETGEMTTKGLLNNMRVHIVTNGLSIIGSLSKYMYGGNNIYPLDRHTTEHAIEQLSDTLHFQISEAKVTGLEFGTNFIMKHPIPNYLSMLGDMPLLQRYHFEASTLYYKGKGKIQPKVFCFYDKKADAAVKDMVLPIGFDEANLLRYEMRLKGRLPQQLGVPEVIASTLSDEKFYRILMQRYQRSYFSISKQKRLKTNVMSEIKTVSDAFDVFAARLISQSGNTQIVDFLEELKDAKVFNDRKNYTRLKNKIQCISTKASTAVSDELIKELDDCIKNAGAYV